MNRVMRRVYGPVIAGVAVAAAAAGLIVGSAGAGAARPATLAAVNRFVNLTEQAAHGRFTATYKIALFRYGGRVFQGRVSVASWALGQMRFRETPAFMALAGRAHAYEVLELRSGYVSCLQVRSDSRWQCNSEAGDGMGGMWLLNGAMVPQALVLGLNSAVAAYTNHPGAPYPLFLSRGSFDGHAVRCLSVGNRRGVVGRVCTMSNGLIASYRMARSISDAGYAAASLVSYSSRVSRGVLRPPSKPTIPALAPKKR